MSAFAQPATLTPTNQLLLVNATTGAIVGPISSANFIANNGLLSAAGIAAAYQPLHPNLTAIAGLTGAADRLFYFDGTTTVAITTFTAVARQLLDDATLADMRTTLGLGSGDTPNFSISGNAASATVLQNARTIGNVSFNGATNIVPETTAIVDSSDSTSYVLVVDSATGNLQAKTDPGITYNSGTGGLTLTGSITAAGNSLVRNFSIQSGNSTGIIFGADDAGLAVTDATMKGMTIGMPHYTNAEEKVLFVRLTSSSGSNTLNIGGGSSNNNAITSFNVYTAPSNTTTTGTRRGGFDSAGKFDVTATTASNNTTSGSAVFGGGIGVGGAINAGDYVTSPRFNHTQGTLTYAASTEIDFNSTSEVVTLALTGSVTFTTLDLAPGRSMQVLITSDGSIRAFTFPGGWKFLGSAAPANIAANKTGVLSLYSSTSADSGVLATWVVET